MANKKKRPQTEKKKLRILKAKIWLLTYEGNKVVRAYRKKFHVDIGSAVRELQEIGYEFQPGYVDNVLNTENARIEQKRKKKREAEEQKQFAEEYDEFQDDKFYYIAGYTPNGVPYGITWEEMDPEFEKQTMIKMKKDK